MKRTVISLMILASAACSGSDAPGTDPVRAGRIMAAIQTASSDSVTRVKVNVDPAAISQDLHLDKSSGAFTGTIQAVPVGAQTLTATAYAGTTVVGTGTGTATVTVAMGATAAAYIKILDSTASAATPDMAPVIVSLVASNANPMAGEEITLTGTAIAPGGDALAYAWADDCSGVFDNATVASTGWSSSAVASCGITLTVSSQHPETSPVLTDSRAQRITVGAAVGSIDVSGVFIPQPVIDTIAVTLASAGGSSAACAFERVGSTDSTCRTPLPADADVTVDLSARNVDTFSEYSLLSDCGGSVAAPTVTSGGARFTWHTPTQGAVCVLTARVDQGGLSDTYPVAFIVDR